jgi:hypothetical protein
MAELASSILIGLAVRFAGSIAKKTGEAFPNHLANICECLQ